LFIDGFNLVVDELIQHKKNDRIGNRKKEDKQSDQPIGCHALEPANQEKKKVECQD
jgi:hypothetical protein